MSDCGRHGITIIAFVGSVFSPYYHWARSRADGQADPEAHCCINVALYSPGARRWTMTERGRGHMERDAQHFRVGPSELRWDGDALVIDIVEWSNPLPRRVRGSVRLQAPRFFGYQTPLDPGGRHRWGPLAPSARIEVAFTEPQLRWEGEGYLDSNEGDESIEDPFHEWDWSRAPLSDGSTAVIYDVRDRIKQADGASAATQVASADAGSQGRLIALRFTPQGTVEPFDPGPRRALRAGLWGVGRSIRSDEGAPAARVHRTLEDTPFYMRSMVSQRLLGEDVIAMHETLYVPRLRSGLVRLMLPWRMPRLR